MYSNESYKQQKEYKRAQTVNDFIDYYKKYLYKLDIDEDGDFIRHLVTRRFKDIVKVRDEYFNNLDKDEIDECYKQLEKINI